MPAFTVRSEVLQRLWRGHDPMTVTVVEDRPPDPQGWNSGHGYLTQAIAEVRPKVALEIGVWKGGSVMTMAQAMKAHQIDGVVIAVDTWRGSWEHWLAPQGQWGLDIIDDLGLDRGHSRLYEKFIANVRTAELQDFVVPLPLDSNNAAHVLMQLGMRIGVLHIDGGHDYDTVSKDLRLWWPMIEPGGILICDDYYADASQWAEVCQAVNEFAQAMSLAPFESGAGKAMLKKPPLPAH